MNADTVAAPKVAIYGTGFVAQAITRILFDKEWPIVAAYNRAGPKIGKDLGQLAGVGRDLSVIVDDIENADCRALDADIAVIAGPDFLSEAFPLYEPFLTAGINVLSCGSEAYDPHLIDPAIAERIDTLARANGVTFCGGGLWDATRIWPGLLVAAPCLRVDALEYWAETEALRQGLHWAPLLGVGLTVEEFDDTIGRTASPMNAILRIPMLIALKHYGYDVIAVTMGQEPIVLDEDIYSAELGRRFTAGVCVGTRTTIDVSTKQGIAARSRFDYRLFRDGEVEHGTWQVHGLPGFRIRVERDDSGVAQASSVANRIPDVVRAAPGIMTVLDLGPGRPCVLP
jgi:4-hydroxy-tetrahydrodipicolinate reductase